MTSQDLALGSTISIRGVGPSSGDGSSLSGARLANVTRCRPRGAVRMEGYLVGQPCINTPFTGCIFIMGRLEGALRF